MLSRLKTLFSKPEPVPEVLDLDWVMAEVKKKEAGGEIPLGQRIFSFDYASLLYSLDREITKNYRLTIYNGEERLFSFTIFAQLGNYEILRQALEQSIAFMDSERKIANLPKNDILIGFFYGY